MMVHCAFLACLFKLLQSSKLWSPGQHAPGGLDVGSSGMLQQASGGGVLQMWNGSPRSVMCLLAWLRKDFNNIPSSSRCPYKGSVPVAGGFPLEPSPWNAAPGRRTRTTPFRTPATTLASRRVKDLDRLIVWFFVYPNRQGWYYWRLKS